MTSTHPKSESALLLAMANAQTTDEQRQIAAELETVRRAKRTQDEADRMSSLSLAALAFPDSDTERHTSTASSDWLADIEVPQVDRTEMENQMRAQATVWLQGRPAEVRADGEEFRTQAASKAHYLSNHFPGHREAAAEAFLDQIRTLAVEDWARADDDAVSVSDADQHEKVEFEGATADEEAETSASDSPSLAEGTEPEGDTPMDDSDPAWQGKNHDDSTFNREDAGQTVARRKTAASTHSLSVGDRVMLTQDGKEREFEVTSIAPPGSTGRAESAGPRVTVTLVGGKGYSVSFDNHSQPGISSWSKVSARMAGRRKTATSGVPASTCSVCGEGIEQEKDGSWSHNVGNDEIDHEAKPVDGAWPESSRRAASRKTAGLTFRGEEYYVGAVGRNGSPKTAQNCQNCGREVFNQEAYVTAWSDGATQKVLCRPCGDDVERGVTASRKTAAPWVWVDDDNSDDGDDDHYGERGACVKCGADVEFVGVDPSDFEKQYGAHGPHNGWWDRGGNYECPQGGYHESTGAGEDDDFFEAMIGQGDAWERTSSRKTAAEYQGGSPKEGDTATCHKDGGKIQFFAGEWMHLKGTGDSHNDVYPGKAKESSRKTAISLSNVGVESDTVGTGTDPSGKKVRFSITPAEAKQLKDILFSDLAINFSGVDVEESDIIKEGGRKTALSGCSCAHNTDGSVTTMLCPIHASEDPCWTYSRVTGKRRKGSIVRGVCTNCGWAAKTASRKTALTPVSELTPGDVIDPWGDGPWRVMNMKPGEFHSGTDVTLRLNDGREITYPFDSTEKVKKVATRTATEGRKAASRAGDDFSWAFDKKKESSRRKKVSNRRVAHNGWTNWDTWNAALWINNEEGIYRAALGTESPEALRALVEDFGLTGDGFDSDKVNWEEVWTDSEFGPNHQGSRRTSRMAGGPAPFGRSPRRHHAVDQADKPCASCGRPVGWLEVFPNFGGEGILCIDCYSRTPEGRRMPTSDELTRMWGGPVRQGSRKQATVGEPCPSCGGKGYYSTVSYDYDPYEGNRMEVTCSTCGGSGVVNEPDEYPLADDPIFTDRYSSRKVASRKVDTSRRTAGGGEAWQAAQEGGHASQVEFALSMLGVPEDQIDSATRDFLAQWDGSGDAGEQAQQWYDSRTASRKTAREAMVCETCGKEVEHADWDRCPHCGSSAGVEWETVASRRQAAAEGDRAIAAWAFSEAGVPDHLIDDLVDRFLAQWRGGQGIWPAAQAWVAGHVGSRRNHPSAGVDFSWAFANSKNSRKVQK